MPKLGVSAINALEKTQQILLRSQEAILRSQEVLRISRAVQADRERSARAKALKLRPTMDLEDAV